jgi:shikimate kinase
MNMNFENKFVRWLNVCLSENIPENLEGFHFNFFRPAGVLGVTFGIDLIGSDTFDNDDPDWPCNEIWEPKQRCLFIPTSYTGAYWQDCLTKMKSLLGRCLETDSEAIRKLKSATGIGVGFVDGDIEILWIAT